MAPPRGAKTSRGTFGGRFPCAPVIPAVRRRDVGIDGGVELGPGNRHLRFRLEDPRDGDLQVMVGGERCSNQLLERGILEQLPPREVADRGRRHTYCGPAVRVWQRHGRPVVVRADGARRKKDKHRQQGKARAPHRGAPDGCGRETARDGGAVLRTQVRSRGVSLRVPLSIPIRHGAVCDSRVHPVIRPTYSERSPRRRFATSCPVPVQPLVSSAHPRSPSAATPLRPGPSSVDPTIRAVNEARNAPMLKHPACQSV